MPPAPAVAPAAAARLRRSLRGPAARRSGRACRRSRRRPRPGASRTGCTGRHRRRSPCRTWRGCQEWCCLPVKRAVLSGSGDGGLDFGAGRAGGRRDLAGGAGGGGPPLIERPGDAGQGAAQGRASFRGRRLPTPRPPRPQGSPRRRPRCRHGDASSLVPLSAADAATPAYAIIDLGNLRYPRHRQVRARGRILLRRKALNAPVTFHD
jgi:hypothetical protein